VVECGTGLPLVLVHGLGGPPVWSRVLGLLSDRFHVVDVDLPGFGNSDCPTVPFSTTHYAEFLNQLLSVLGLDHVILAGISYGGQIAAATAVNYPNKVGMLVLIAPTGVSGRPLLDQEPVWYLVRTLIKHIIFKNVRIACFISGRSFYDLRNRPENICKEFLSHIIPEERTEAWLVALRNTFRFEPDWIVKLQTVRTPALILWGKEDRVVSPDDGVQLSRVIAQSRLVVFEKCGHALPLEKPDELAGAIVDFVEGISR